jgi:hypothetical protein
MIPHELFRKCTCPSSDRKNAVSIITSGWVVDGNYTVLDMQCFRKEETEVRGRGIDGVRLKSRKKLQLWRTSTITSIM